MKIYISSSWKNRNLVREISNRIRKLGHKVYDFTDPRCRASEEITMEKLHRVGRAEVYLKSSYKEHLARAEWMSAVLENKRALNSCDLVILLLPCGIDAHSDWAYAVGRNKRTIIVGTPEEGERSLVHLWADRLFECSLDAINWLETLRDDFIHF